MVESRGEKKLIAETAFPADKLSCPIPSRPKVMQ